MCAALSLFAILQCSRHVGQDWQLASVQVRSPPPPSFDELPWPSMAFNALPSDTSVHGLPCPSTAFRSLTRQLACPCSTHSRYGSPTFGLRRSSSRSSPTASSACSGAISRPATAFHGLRRPSSPWRRPGVALASPWLRPCRSEVQSQSPPPARLPLSSARDRTTLLLALLAAAGLLVALSDEELRSEYAYDAADATLSTRPTRLRSHYELCLTVPTLLMLCVRLPLLLINWRYLRGLLQVQSPALPRPSMAVLLLP